MQEALGDGCKRLIAVPGDIKRGLKRRFQRPEYQPAFFGSIDQMAKGQQISEAFPREDGAVVGQTERALQFHFRKRTSKPFFKIPVPGLLRTEQRDLLQVFYLNYSFFRQRISFRDHQSPHIFFRKGQILILPAVRQLRQNQEIQEPFVQLVRDLLRIAAGDVVMQIRVAGFKVFDHPGKIPDLERLRQPQIQFSSTDVI